MLNWAHPNDGWDDDNCNNERQFICKVKYFGHRGSLSWADAQATCEAEGMNLPSLHSIEEENVFKNAIRDLI